MTTPLLQMPEYTAGQLQPEIPINTVARILEQGCTRFVVLADDLTAPPGGEMDGDAYRVASGATGAWYGKDDHIALFIGTGWYFVAPREGLRYQLAGGSDFQFNGIDSPPAGWSAVASGGSGAVAYETVTIVSGAVDCSDETVAIWSITLTEDITALTLPTALAGESLSIIVLFTQDGTGSRTVSGWPSVNWESGGAPSINSAAGSITSVPLLILGDGSIYGVG